MRRLWNSPTAGHIETSPTVETWVCVCSRDPSMSRASEGGMNSLWFSEVKKTLPLNKQHKCPFSTTGT